MDIFALAERAMKMDDTAWMRHAHPFSVFSRFTCLPLIALAVWSRDWLGWWCLVPLALAVLWTWANPRAFPRPRRTDNWASKGTFGERVFLNRKTRPIPAHHLHAARTLSLLSALGIPFLVWGLWHLDVAWTSLGLVLTIVPKLWFVDRMVWLYEDMKTKDARYSSWLRGTQT